MDADDFVVEIPPEHQIVVDSRVYEAKLEDSYQFGKILKYIYDVSLATEDGSVEADLWLQISDHVIPADAVIAMLGRLIVLENAAKTVAKIIADHLGPPQTTETS